MIAEKSEAGAIRTNYTGVAMVSLVGMNLTADEMKSLGIISKEYYEEIKNKPVERLLQDGRYRLDFHMKVEENVPVPVYVRTSIYVSENPVPAGRATGKVKVMNQSQNFAWVSPEDLETMAPQVSPKSIDGKPWFTGPYRLSTEGEEELYSLLKLVTGMRKDDKLPKVDFAKVIRGDNKSIAAIVSPKDGRKNSFFKVMLGEQITPEGRVYQQVWRTPMSQYSQDNVYRKIHAEILGYLNNTSKNYNYGISPEYDIRDFVFRKAKEISMEEPQTPNGESMMANEDKSNFADSPDTGGSEDDLPF